MKMRVFNTGLRFGPLATMGLLVLTGCSSFRTEMGRPQLVKANTFTEGQTSAGTVMREMGPPNHVSQLPEGFAFLYEHSCMKEFQLGISVNLSVLRWLKFVRGWNSLDQEAQLLTFDNQGILQSVGAGHWNESLGGGTAAQLVFSAMGLSDVSELLRPADAHAWGKELLQPLPVGLNSAQSLRTGQHGLQQRIAPPYAGQRTLEMSKPKSEKEKKRLKKNYQTQP